MSPRSSFRRTGACCFQHRASRQRRASSTARRVVRFSLFGAGAKPQAKAAAAETRRLGKLERNALADLDLDEDADGPAIRARYIELVKRTHPDSNGGDRSAEHKLQRVIKAYQLLKKSKLA